MRRATLLLGLSLGLASFAVAQPSKEDFGAPAVDAPPEVKRIDFLRGEWEVTMKTHPALPLNTPATAATKPRTCGTGSLSRKGRAGSP